jgi:hypothetical protein
MAMSFTSHINLVSSATGLLLRMKCSGFLTHFFMEGKFFTFLIILLNFVQKCVEFNPVYEFCNMYVVNFLKNLYH